MINLDKLTRKYGDFTAVDDVSFAISPGEIVGLLGHNGAGKTTIMKMITGYLEPTSGSVTVDGIDVVSDRRKVQRKIGYLPENCPVYPEMTVIDYLDYSASLRGIRANARLAMITEAISRTGLKEKATWPIAKLSRGYRQRTGVAQAILHRPDILILDEPTNGLDPTQIQQMRSLITDLAKHSTVIISTHILQEVQAICDRVIIMKDGRKALDARLTELNRNDRLLIIIDAPPAIAEKELARMTGVGSVAVSTAHGSSTHTYALNLETPENRQQTAATIAAAVHEKGWQLFAMHFEFRNLETVFAEISA
ncbi:ABC transporter ATP-binding protein [Desulfopila aestuarii]|uniref:ABC-2 type transport system ATP-binding protein n=1 Tax=Desulfopila aestuarii DSM 18488 TaxID=1121416 RepID=A0A1M7XWJ0_9BACT|nr:ATP-binding cassette domain-containing protein [Desulfopila aestuarii]SHO43135.1 ABC-2 type transport system ATP-binding protein [Desulfopila aestuarii DSM 18488]